MNHSVIDKDKYFQIDSITREVRNESSPKKITIIQHDHNSERFTFECPRYIEGHDMSLCNDVKVHYINIDGKTSKENKDIYEVADLRVNPDNEDTVICSWLISQNATQLVGTLVFIVRYSCLSGSIIDYSWNTARTTVNISDGINNTDFIATEYVDILEKWESELYNAGYINAKTMQNDIEVLKSRFDNFTALKEGSTTGDSELQDIRVGANGVIYETAGTSVREQFLEISRGISAEDVFLDNQVKSYNLNNLEAANIGYYLSTNDEILTMSASQAYTDYIAVKTGEKYIARHPWGAQWSVSFYDEDKKLVSQQSYTEDTVIDPAKTNDSINTSYWHCITIPKGVCYIRTNFGTSTPLYTMVIKGDKTEDIPTEYIEYKAEILSKAFLNAIHQYISEKSGIINDEDNTVLGYNALPISEGVKYNVAIGANSLSNILVDTEIDNQSGRYNVAVGGNAMKGTTTGNHNTACGFQAMLDNTTGTANTAVGEDSLMSNSKGNFNVAIGCRTLQSATEGDYNTAVGLGAGYWNDELHPTGSRNTMIGSHSGQSDGNGSGNIAVGYFAKASNGLNDTIVIGNSTMAEKDGQTIIGSNSTVETILRGDLIIQGSDGIKRQIVFNANGSLSWRKVD